MKAAINRPTGITRIAGICLCSVILAAASACGTAPAANTSAGGSTRVSQPTVSDPPKPAGSEQIAAAHPNVGAAPPPVSGSSTTGPKTAPAGAPIVVPHSGAPAGSEQIAAAHPNLGAAPSRVSESSRTGSKTALGSAPIVVPYSGAPAAFTVPDGMITAHILLRGGDGAGVQVVRLPRVAGGQGQQLTIDLPVQPGQVITAAVGGTGAAATGRLGGSGGWSLGAYRGGLGGADASNYGASGGGGSSVIELDGSVTAVAAGGGGTAYVNNPAKNSSPGGAGGTPAGGAGGGPHAGLGGSDAHPNLDSQGAAFTNALMSFNAGGGGGGGYHVGGGGGESSGGGGGSSWVRPGVPSALQPPTVNQGYVSIDFGDTPLSTAYSFAKTHAPTTQLLEINGGSTAQGAAADTWSAGNSAGGNQANQTWLFRRGKDGFGLLVNRGSGMCLQVNGTDGKIDQWFCQPGSANHHWTLIDRPTSGTALQVVLTVQTGPWQPGTYYLATADGSSNVTDGSPLTLMTDLVDDRTSWDIQQQ